MLRASYILRCADDSLYVGSTDDLSARVLKHNEGRASRFTATRRPVRLAYLEALMSLEQARSRERQLKRWTRRKKEALIERDLDLLKRL